MGQFAVHIVAPRDRASGKPVAKIYDGDDWEVAVESASKAVEDPQWKGMILRFYNFSLFGGGMKDTPIV